MSNSVFGWDEDIMPVLAIMFDERIAMYLN